MNSGYYAKPSAKHLHKSRQNKQIQMKQPLVVEIFTLKLNDNKVGKRKFVTPKNALLRKLSFTKH